MEKKESEGRGTEEVGGLSEKSKRRKALKGLYNIHYERVSLCEISLGGWHPYHTPRPPGLFYLLLPQPQLSCSIPLPPSLSLTLSLLLYLNCILIVI
jgi:hypothetical protein